MNRDKYNNDEKFIIPVTHKPVEPKHFSATTIMSRAIEQCEELGFKVVVAMMDMNNNGQPVTVSDRVYCFTDIETSELRRKLYTEIERGENETL